MMTSYYSSSKGTNEMCFPKSDLHRQMLSKISAILSQAGDSNGYMLTNQIVLSFFINKFYHFNHSCKR